MKVISEGKRYRECVEVGKDKKGVIRSVTFHQEKVDGSWVERRKKDAKTQPHRETKVEAPLGKSVREEI